MALIVEDGTGKPNAQVVADLDYCKAYLGAIGATVPVDALLEQQLVAGWMLIENGYRGRWKGERVKLGPGQALAWPRYGVVDEDGYEYPSDVIPKAVKDANCHATIIIAKGGDTGSSAVTSETKKVGDVTYQVQYASAQTTGGSEASLLQGLLAGLVWSAPMFADFSNMKVVRS